MSRQTSPKVLPEPLSSFVGREDDIATIVDVMRQSHVRLVTLTGPGGVGKTRLAMRASKALEADYADGIAAVSLASVSDPGMVPPAIARALGVRDNVERAPLEQIANAIVDRELLIVLDNFEHVLEAVGCVPEILRAGPTTKVLVTSRERLRLAGEREIPIRPLPLPDRGNPSEPDPLVHSPAIRLFVDRARDGDPGFALTSANAAAVAEICRRVDGLPLGIELAASRIKAMPPQALLARLELRLPLLVGGARDAPARQQTLRDAIAWSYDLLDPTEQALFRRLAVFVGGFGLESAEAVGRGLPSAERPVVQIVSALLERNLVRRQEGTELDPRYGMLETIREFALERLTELGEFVITRRVQADYFLALARVAQPAFGGPDQRMWLSRLEAEYANLQDVLAWLAASGESLAFLQLAGSLGEFWYRHGHLREGRRWLEHALAVSSGEPAVARAEGLLWAGYLSWSLGDRARASDLARQSLAIWRSLGDDRGQAIAIHLLGLGEEIEQRWEPATRLFEQELSIWRHRQEPHRTVSVLVLLGGIAYGKGDLERAAGIEHEALELARTTGDRRWIALALWYLGQIALARRSSDEAAGHFHGSLELLAEIGDRWWLAKPLAGLAVVAARRRQPARAARLLGAVNALLEGTGAPVMPFDRVNHEAAESAAVAELGRDAFVSAYRAGQALPLSDAVAEAQATAALGGAPRAAVEDNRYGLSAREREVFRLIAAGHSNGQISRELGISLRTVTTHASHILNKLGLTTRSELIAVAYREELI